MAVLFFLSGFFMKLSDDACDVGDDKSLAIALGLLCAITSAFATVSSASLSEF